MIASEPIPFFVQDVSQFHRITPASVLIQVGNVLFKCLFTEAEWVVTGLLNQSQQTRVGGEDNAQRHDISTSETLQVDNYRVSVVT